MHIWGSITHNPVSYPIYSLHLTCPCRGDTVRSSGGWAFVALLLISASAHRCECSCVVSSMFARVQSGPVSGAQRGTAGSFSLTSTPTAPLLVSVCQGPSCVLSRACPLCLTSLPAGAEPRGAWQAYSRSRPRGPPMDPRSTRHNYCSRLGSTKKPAQNVWEVY